MTLLFIIERFITNTAYVLVGCSQRSYYQWRRWVVPSAQHQSEIRTFSSFFMRLFLNDRALRYSMRRYNEPNIDDGGDQNNEMDNGGVPGESQ